MSFNSKLVRAKSEAFDQALEAHFGLFPRQRTTGLERERPNYAYALFSYLLSVFFSISFTLEGIHYNWISGEVLDGLGASERLGCLVVDGLRVSDQEHIFGLLIQQKMRKKIFFLLFCTS